MPAGSICGSRVRYAGYGRCLTCAVPGYYSQCWSDTTSTVVKRRWQVLRTLSDTIPSTWLSPLIFLYKLFVRDTSGLYLGDIIWIPLYPATDGRQFCRRYKIHVDGDKWIQLDTTCIRQHVSWCKRGLKLSVNRCSTKNYRKAQTKKITSYHTSWKKLQ